MSVAAIILGLLVWFAFPPLYKRKISKRSYFYLRLCCKFIGFVIVAVGVLVGIF